MPAGVRHLDMSRGVTPGPMFFSARNEYAYACSLVYAMGYRAKKNPLPGLFVPCQKCLRALGGDSVVRTGPIRRIVGLAAF